MFLHDCICQVRFVGSFWQTIAFKDKCLNQELTPVGRMQPNWLGFVASSCSEYLIECKGRRLREEGVVNEEKILVVKSVWELMDNKAKLVRSLNNGIWGMEMKLLGEYRKLGDGDGSSLVEL